MQEPAKTQWAKIQVMALARAFSILGTELTIFTLVFREKELGPSAVAALFIVGALPTIIFSPVAGTIADRFSTKTVIPILAVIAGSAVLAQTQRLDTWAILTLLFIANTCYSIIGPTWAKLTPLLATKDDISRAMGTIQSYFSLASLFGPAVAGILVSQTGFVITFLIDGIVTILIAVVPFLIGVNHEPEKLKEGEKTEMTKGFSFIWQNNLLRSLVILVFTMVLCLSVINVGDVFLLTDVLGADALVYGLVGSFFAVGTLLFSLFSGAKKFTGKQELQILGVGMAILALSALGVGLAIHYAIVMVIWFVAGMANATINSYGVGMMIKVTPYEFQGRVFAAFGALVAIASIVAMSLAGVLIDAFGVREVFIVAGIASFIAFIVLFPTVYKEQIKILTARV